MWYYNGGIFTSEDIGDNVGFVYLIYHNETGKTYIGQKKFIATKRKVVKKKSKRIKCESDWQNYWGSNLELQADVIHEGREMFTRIILHLCKSKGMMNYIELKEQMDRDVLLRNDYYNSFVGGKIHRKHVQSSLTKK